MRQDFKTQENDRELFVRQLVMQKKENQKYKDEIEEFKKLIEAKEMDEEEIDLNNIDQEDVNYQNLPPQSKLM